VKRRKGESIKSRDRQPQTGGRKLILVLGALLWLAGCCAPNALEQDLGRSVANNIAQQVVNPQAGFDPTPAVGLPPATAVNVKERYDKSFKAEEKKPMEMKMITGY